jgi:hypothetical protein
LFLLRLATFLPQANKGDETRFKIHSTFDGDDELAPFYYFKYEFFGTPARTMVVEDQFSTYPLE